MLGDPPVLTDVDGVVAELRRCPVAVVVTLDGLSHAIEVNPARNPSRS